ncbi:Hypothetical protein POVR2_LOCUS316 [uncultured virus]|nr:Hypothetical protein POVR2_LOCUS316 [uncultured virus]
MLGVSPADYTLDEIPLYYYLGNLDDLLVAEEIYSHTRDTAGLLEAMSATPDLDIFKYLETSVGSTTLLWSMLEEHMEHDKILDYLLTCYSPDRVTSPTEQEEDISDLLSLGIEHQEIRILQLLEPYKDERDDGQELLDEAINVDNLDIFKYVFEHYDSDETDIVYRIVSSDALEIFKYWISSHSISQKKLRLALLQSMSRYTFSQQPSEIAEYIESIVDIHWNELLDEAIQYYPDAIVSILARPDFSVNIYNLLDRMTKSRPSKVIWTILRDDTIRVENMPRGLASRLFEGLLLSDCLRIGTLSLKLAAYREGTGHGRGLQDLKSSYLEGQQATSIILRQLMFKQVTKKSLLDWLIGLKSKQVSLAAAAVLDRSLVYVDNEIAPIRALLISMLYPKMTLVQAIAALYGEGYRGEVLARTGGLLGLYYSLPD